MSVPTFTAEVSLYKSTRLYRGHSGRTRVDTASNVVPADTTCEIGCGVADGICLGLCTASGPFFPLCAAACQTATVACLLNCQDGGGDPSCCPPGTTCRCGGHCISGLCTGVCLSPGAACPPPPPPPPIGCAVGEKCCERDKQGNCTFCIRHNQQCP
jgi:hypothetical protein